MSNGLRPSFSGRVRLAKNKTTSARSASASANEHRLLPHVHLLIALPKSPEKQVRLVTRLDGHVGRSHADANSPQCCPPCFDREFSESAEVHRHIFHPKTVLQPQSTSKGGACASVQSPVSTPLVDLPPTHMLAPLLHPVVP
jgi:hypothetical protein